MSLDAGPIARGAAGLCVIATLGGLSTFALAAADANVASPDLLTLALLAAVTLVIVVGAASREPRVAVRHCLALVLGMLAGTTIPVPNGHARDDAALGASPWEIAVPLVLFATGVAMLFFCGWLLGSTMRELGTSRRRRAAPATASKQGDGPR
ncbi:MAG: hypothetical protein J0L92_22165 [Deltaproteobacteria bacterium]|nr:hypothetical protein [Deltaproteobacteria bacterium]